MINMIKRYFRFEELGTDFRHEIIGGLTTFITMAYIIIVNPKILEAAGIPFGPSMVATIVSAFFGTMLMAVYAKRPFAVAPYMGQNAFVAFTVVKVMGFSWQTALGAIFVGGLLFTALTLFRIRSWLANLIPINLKVAFAGGIGLFLTFIGLNESGIVTIGVPGAPVNIGKLSQPGPVLAIVAVVIIALLMIRKIKGVHAHRDHGRHRCGHRAAAPLAGDRAGGRDPGADTRRAGRAAPQPGTGLFTVRYFRRPHLGLFLRHTHRVRHGLRGHDGHADRPLLPGRPA